MLKSGRDFTTLVLVFFFIIVLSSTTSQAISDPNSCAADFYNNGVVDGDDLATFIADFGRTDCDSPPPCEGDFEPDGEVGVADLVVFAADFGRTDCRIAPPEDAYYGLSDDEQQGGSGLVGETVRILNGNLVEIRSDINFPSPYSPGLGFTAVYNSGSEKPGSLGAGWTHNYEVAMDPDYTIGPGSYIKISDPTGRSRFFQEDVAGTFKGIYTERSQVKLESGEYIWHRLDGSKLGFSGTGRLNWIDDEKGNRLSIAYDAENQVNTVTDNASGRVLTFVYVDGLLDRIIGPATAAVSDGVHAIYGYDGNQNLTSVVYPDGSGVIYNYTDPNDIHNLTAKRNSADHLMNTWSYDNKDRCIDNFSRQGRGVSINYLSETRVEVTDAYGTLRTYTIGDISGHRRVVAMSPPANPTYNGSSIVRWEYDADVHLTEVETAGGTIHHYLNHDSRGNPQTVIPASGTPEQRTITYTYHSEMKVPLIRSEPSVLGAGNKVTTWDYDDDYNADPNQNPTRLISRLVEQGFTRDSSGATVPYEYITTFTYNFKGQVVSIDGPLAGSTDTTTFAYEGATGNLESVVQPLIGTTGFLNYDAAGQPATVIDVNGQADNFTYDGRGRITGIMHSADSSTRTMAYNTAGLPHMVTDEDGVYFTFEYDDAYGRLVRKNDVDGNYILYAYDSQGNLIERSRYSESNDIFSHRRWDYQHPTVPGRLFKEIKYDNSSSQYDYDADGNVSAVTDFNLNTTSYEYDPLNRLITATQPGSAITSYEYDLHGNLVSVLDAESHETTFTYDDMGRAVATVSPDSGATAYAYDAAGNLAQKTDANAIAVQYTYDVLNRLTGMQFPDSAQDIVYTYDVGTYGKGRRTGMTDPGGSTTFGYDSRGRLTSKTTIIDAIYYTISRTYTAGNRLVSFVCPSGRTVNFARYSNKKIENVSTTHNTTTVDLFSNMTYNPFGRPSGMDTGTGNAVANQSGACNCLEKINPGQMMEQDYTQDSNGNITQIQAPNVSWLNQSFVYDALNRLDSATGAYGTINYTYDNIGNRLTRAVGGQIDTYSYISGTNKLDAITGANPAAFSYDVNGNITGIDLKTFVYNQNNRLIRVEEGANVLGEYTYNGLGQRVIKDAGGVATIFHYDFDGNIIAESSLTGTLTSEYLYMGSNRVAMVDVSTGDLYYYNNNYLGTPLVMTDSSGNVVWDADYKPFGEANVKSNPTVANNFRFAGQYYDSETGLHYNYHRYYDPKTGRYLTPDPIGLAGGINLYAYADQNPINETDFYGLLPYSVEGVYEFIGTDGRPYVGQSSNWPTRLKHWVRKGRLDPNTEVTVTEVFGGKKNREAYEFRRIRDYTGDVPARRSELVSNRVDPIGKNRSHLRNKQIAIGKVKRVRVSGLRGFGYITILSDLIFLYDAQERAERCGTDVWGKMLEDMGVQVIYIDSETNRAIGILPES